MKKRGMLMAFLLVLALAVAFIPGDAYAAKKKSKVKLNKTSATLSPGATLQLKVKNSKKSATWKSSKKSVATVNSKGLVTAKAAGKATITAKVGKKSLKCKVTVKNVVKNIPLLGAKAVTHTSYVYKIESTDKAHTYKIDDYVIVPEDEIDEWEESYNNAKATAKQYKEEDQFPNVSYIGTATASMTDSSITYQNFDTVLNGYKGECRYNFAMKGSYNIPDELLTAVSKKTDWNNYLANDIIIDYDLFAKNNPYQLKFQNVGGTDEYIYPLVDVKRHTTPGTGQITNVTLNKQAKTFAVTQTNLEEGEEATRGKVALNGFFENYPEYVTPSKAHYKMNAYSLEYYAEHRGDFPVADK